MQASHVVALIAVGLVIFLRFVQRPWGRSAWGGRRFSYGRSRQYRPRRALPGSELVNVVGSRFGNSDGSSRQEALAKCRRGEPITLRPEPATSPYKGGIQVLRATGEQIGYLPRGHGLGQEIGRGEIRAILHEVYGGMPGKPFMGAVLQITSQRESPQRSFMSASHRLLWPALTMVILLGAVGGFFAPDLSSWFPNLATHGVAASSSAITGRPRTIDGDTIKIGSTRIRLFGIDAPESRQSCQNAAGQEYACGERATAALEDHIGAAAVSCEPRDIDRYGRTVAVCFLGSEDLDAWMVAQGWAVAYRHYSMDYVPQEEAAHAAGLGVWAGTFVMPWDWRQEH